MSAHTPIEIPTRQLTSPPRAFPRAAQAEFLRILAQWGNVRGAAQAAGVSRSAAYRQRRECLMFAQLWDAALLCAKPQVEDVLADRALNGTQETVFYHGEEVATRTRYDSRLLLAHLGRLDKLELSRRVKNLSSEFDFKLEELEKAPDSNALEE